MANSDCEVISFDSALEEALKRGCQHPSHRFEILWQVALNSISSLFSYFVAQYVLIIVV